MHAAGHPPILPALGQGTPKQRRKLVAICAHNASNAALAGIPSAPEVGAPAQLLGNRSVRTTLHGTEAEAHTRPGSGAAPRNTTGFIALATDEAGGS